MSDALIDFGWSPFFDAQLSPEERSTATVARIVEPLRGLSRAISSTGEVWAECLEKVGPSVGDWVVGRMREHGTEEKRLSISRTLQRYNQLSRAAPGGKGYEQILCANVDVVFVVLDFNQDLNLSRVMRYLEWIHGSQLVPVIVLTKVDEPHAAVEAIASLQKIATDTPVHSLSVHEASGMESIRKYFTGGKTVVLIGASGAGKSTLANHLLGGNNQRVGEVRESDQKGRHTTTGRKLYRLSTGGMVIDSPGIREIQRWAPPDSSPGAKKPTKAAKRPKHRQNFSSDDDE